MEPKTIDQQIDCLARLTGAPDSFVTQVRDLFSSKGIPLDADASPYVGALEEAFTREESIRSTTDRARGNVARLQSNFRKIGEAYVEQLQRHKRSRKRAARPREDSREGTTEVMVDGDHRSYITPVQYESLPMVPGPEEAQ
jgi:hypothetical protein